MMTSRPEILPCREARRVIVMAMTVLGMMLCGCGERAGSPPPSAPLSGSTVAILKADPNPIPKTAERFGKTKIIWDTGDGSWGQVYVVANGGEEKLFMQERSGSKEVAWIGKNGIYEFRLYSGTDRKKMLATMKVTMER